MMGKDAGEKANMLLELVDSRKMITEVKWDGLFNGTSTPCRLFNSEI